MGQDAILLGELGTITQPGTATHCFSCQISASSSMYRELDAVKRGDCAAAPSKYPLLLLDTLKGWYLISCRSIDSITTSSSYTVGSAKTWRGSSSCGISCKTQNSNKAAVKQSCQ